MRQSSLLFVAAKILGMEVEEQLTTRQVADALNVSESSVKRWCDQGAIPTVRTVGGHRRIPSDGFRQFMEKTNRSAAGFGGTDQPSHSAVKPLRDFLAEFETSIVDGNELACAEVLGTCYARCKTFARLGDELIAPTFRRLGELWSCGDIEIYQERRGCEICQRVLHQFLHALPPESPYAPIAVGGTPSGDNYTLSNQLSELVLRECNWKTVNLGPNLPLQTIAQAVQRFNAQLIWLSVSHIEDEQRFITEFADFRQQLPEHARIVLGGRALHDQLRPKLQYTGHCDNLLQLTELAHALRSNQRTA